jgi:hypothetical protein
MSVTTDPYSSGCVTVSNTTDTISGGWYGIATAPYQEPVQIFTPFITEVSKEKIIKEGDDEDMRYLYEVILVNPEDENFEIFEVVAKNETSALMQTYEISDFKGTKEVERVEFDELKTHCRILFEWKKEKSLEKALETIKKAVE